MKNYNTLNNNFKSNFLIFGINTKIKNSFLKVFGLNHRLIPDSLTLKQKLKLNLFLTKFDSGKKLKEFVKNNESKNISIIPDTLNSKTFKLFFIKTFLSIKALSLLAF